MKQTKSIINRSPSQIADELYELSDEDKIKVVLHLVHEAGDWDFVFSLLASAMKVADFEGEWTKKEVAQNLKTAKIIDMWDRE
jgi:hypothetical protein